MKDGAEVGMTHQASPAALLAATEILYGTQPEAYLFSVRGERFEMNEPFSGQVEASIPAAVALLIEQLKKE
jgi:Ni,Fe-hydrogenase maturation factor